MKTPESLPLRLTVEIRGASRESVALALGRLANRISFGMIRPEDAGDFSSDEAYSVKYEYTDHPISLPEKPE